MKVEWMNHTGFVVRDMERCLAFYEGMLGLKRERDMVLEGKIISQLVGYEDAKLHVVYLGNEDMRHGVELIEYINPPGKVARRMARYSFGATHLGLIVDDIGAFYEELRGKGIRFVNPPTYRPDAVYPWARKVCYFQDPEGNWLEFIERPPAPPGARMV